MVILYRICSAEIWSRPAAGGLLSGLLYRTESSRATPRWLKQSGRLEATSISRMGEPSWWEIDSTTSPSIVKSSFSFSGLSGISRYSASHSRLILMATSHALLGRKTPLEDLTGWAGFSGHQGSFVSC